MRISNRWRFSLVRLGMANWSAGFRHDWVARHWWLDFGWFRACVIRRHSATHVR